jgi:trehalose-6-phosphate synthase
MAEAMHQAINMPATERRRRMNRMRAVVSVNNVYRWAGKIVLTLSGIEVGEAADRSPETGESLAVAGVAS